MTKIKIVKHLGNLLRDATEGLMFIAKEEIEALRCAIKELEGKLK